MKASVLENGADKKAGGHVQSVCNMMRAIKISKVHLHNNKVWTPNVSDTGQHSYPYHRKDP